MKLAEQYKRLTYLDNLLVYAVCRIRRLKIRLMDAISLLLIYGDESLFGKFQEQRPSSVHLVS
jgi:hypothetical protein